MTIEEKPGISQENKKYYSTIEELVNHISENMEVINKLGRVTNRRDKLIKIMFSYIKEKHRFNKEWKMVEVLADGNIRMNTTYEHKEVYIQLLTEEIEKYVKIVKRNNGVIKNNLRELSNEKNSVFDKSVDEFIVDSKAVEKRVKEAFYSSITGKDVQQSYVTKINNDPHLSEQARNVSERRRKKTTAEFEALEKAKKLNNSIFASSKYPNNKS
ncbi:MAG: hypothetical protein KJ968_02440 [Nanoarchaeota archaeon]|nr:hypothetical protein [Nanoarchaeota archaeon]